MFPVGIYLLKVNNRNASFSCSSVSTINFEHVIDGWILNYKCSFYTLSTPYKFTMVFYWANTC